MFEGASGVPVGEPAANEHHGDRPVQLAQAPGEPIGNVEELTGVVTLTRGDGSSVTAAPGDPVYLNDTVATSSDGAVEIIFVDGTRFSLGQNGQMTLDQLVYDPTGSSNELDISVLQGAFTFVTGSIAGAPGEGMEVNVPVGTIGIRGTAVGGGPNIQTPDPTDYTIVLLPETGGRVGRIVLTDVNGRSVILDAPLEAMDISSLGLAPGEPVRLTRDQVLDLLGLAVENIEDVLEEIQNLESPEEEQTPEAGPEQRGEVPSAPNTGGINQHAEETQSLDELTSLFSLSDEQGFRTRQSGPLGGLTPQGGLGNSDTPGGPQDDDDSSGDLTEIPVDNQVVRTIIIGGPGDDNLDGSNQGPVEIIGLAGNDTLIGGPGDDILNGGDGIDTVDYSSATQAITVNLATGQASGGPAIGNDTLIDIENVIGGQGSDTIIGNQFANVLKGGAGNDVLMGLGGDDTIDGGSGNDTAVFTGNRSDYVITAGAEGSVVVTDLRADGDGVDTLTNIEFLSFADQTVSVGELFGEHYATNGAAMKTTVTVEAGAVLTLRFNFLDSEPSSAEPFFKDFAVVFINGEAFKLADVDDATGTIGSTSFGFDEQTGYGTFTFTFAEAGEYTIGIAVLNEGDQAYDAGLLVDDVSITGGTFGDGFENSEFPLGQWETLGNVTVQGAVGGVNPAEGEQQALLVSNLASAAEIEAFLGVPAGTLSAAANQPVADENIEYGGAGNAAPIAVDDTIDGAGYSFSTPEDEVFIVSSDELLANDTDPDGDQLFLTAVGNAVGGTVVLGPEGIITFTPDANYNGPASFEYTVTDGKGGTDTATVHLTVIPVNDAPTDLVDEDGTENTVSRFAAVEATVGITAYAVDPDGDEVTYSLDDPSGIFAIDPETGVVTVANRDLLQSTPNQSLAITIIASDAGGLTSSETFFINVTDGGTLGNDVLVGTEGADEIHGLAGNDLIIGLGGDDQLYGDDGNDVLVPGAGYNFLDGGDGQDTVSYADSDYWVSVDLAQGWAAQGYDFSFDTLSNIENVVGSPHSDWIAGDDNDNILIGGGGVDRIYGRGGNDTIVIDGGPDDYNEAAILDGGEGIDTLIFAGENLEIDLHNGSPLSSIERIDITGSGANTIWLSAEDVIAISGDVVFDPDTGTPTARMTILGDADDRVVQIGDWDAAGSVNIDGTVFNVYLGNGAELYVQNGVTVTD